MQKTPYDSLIERLTERQGTLEKIQAEIAKLQHEAELVGVEVKAFTEAVQLMKPPLTNVDLPTAVTNSVDSTVRYVRLRMRTRNTSKIEKIVDATGKVHPNGFGYNDLVSVAEQINLPINKEYLRTAMMNLVNAGAALRVKEGVFQLTEDGKKKLAASADAQQELAPAITPEPNNPATGTDRY